MTTAAEFARTGITGQTFREIREKFGASFNDLGNTDQVMSNYALAFAWMREREHLPVAAAYDKALGLTIQQVVDLFEDGDDPEVRRVADFESPASTTTP